MAIDLNRIIKTHVALLGAAIGTAWLTQWGEPASLALGGAVMGANVWLMRVITEALAGRAARGDDHRRTAVAVAALALKFGLFLGLLALLFTHVPVQGMSFALGVTVLLVACVTEAMRTGRLQAKGVG